MTTTLTHPPAEDLGCFIEGTLDDQARAAIVEHLADCDDCRITVVDAVEFAEPAAFDEKVAVKQSSAGGRWWMAAAAAFVVIVAAGTFVVNSRRETSLTGVKTAFAQLKSRPIEARLSGFNYVERRVPRGERETEPSELQLEAELGKVMEKTGDDPKSLHDRGVALLLAAALENPGDDQDQAKAIAKDKRDAVALLQSAATRVSDNVTYQNDFAAALIATGDYKQASTVCERALQIDHGSRDALFNKAIALSRLDPTKGADAFKRYLVVDSKSPWAGEARRNIDNLL
jgi:tetratricopeptide (TPR) repeat protein